MRINNSGQLSVKVQLMLSNGPSNDSIKGLPKKSVLQLNVVVDGLQYPKKI